VITLKEPPKEEMVAFLDQECRKLPAQRVPTRSARVEITLKTTAGGNELHEIQVNLTESSILKQQVLQGKHSYIDSEYMKEVETACMADQRVQDEIQKLDLPPGASVVIEPWAYATDGQNDMSKRVSMVRTHLHYLQSKVTEPCLSVGFIFACWSTRMQTIMHTR
jgi:primary-amine oxidase